MLTAYTVGGLVHLLLVIALIVVVFQFIMVAGPSDGAAGGARGVDAGAFAKLTRSSH
jgi:hypothetical protein